MGKYRNNGTFGLNEQAKLYMNQMAHSQSWINQSTKKRRGITEIIHHQMYILNWDY